MKEALDGLDLLREAFAVESQLSKEWRQKHDDEALAFRKEILEKIRPFEEFSSGLSMFWKIVLAVSALVMSVVKGLALIKEHYK